MDVNPLGGYNSFSFQPLNLATADIMLEKITVKGDEVLLTGNQRSERPAKQKKKEALEQKSARKTGGEPRAPRGEDFRANKSDTGGWNISVHATCASEIQPGGSRETQAVLSLFKDLSQRTIWGNFGNQAFQPGNIEIIPFTAKDVQTALERGEALARDPAKGGKITPGSIEEAAVALLAEKDGIVVGPAKREETGAAEIIDGAGQAWDVKSPLSPPPGAMWTFDVEHQVVKVRHDLSSGEKVLLNLSKCNPGDTSKVIDLMEHELTADEKTQVAVLINREALPQ